MNAAGDLIPGFEAPGLNALLTGSGFSGWQQLQLHLVIPNLQASLTAVAACLGGHPPEVLVGLLDELDRVMSKYSNADLANLSTNRLSRHIRNPNPFRGQFAGHEIPAALSVTDTKRTSFYKKFHAGIGVVLLSRMAPHAHDEPNQVEREAADGLRKCLTLDSSDWQRAKQFFPEPDENFFSALRGWKSNPQHAFLGDSQRHLFLNLGRLLDGTAVSKLRKPSVATALEDEPNGKFAREPAVRIRQIPVPDEVTAQLEPDDQPGQVLEVEQKKDGGESLARRQLADAANRFVRDNQFLADRWHSLSKEEALYVAGLAEEQTETNMVQGAVGSIVLLTGWHPSLLPDVVVVRKTANLLTAWGSLLLDLEEGVFIHPGPYLPGAFRPSSHQAGFLAPHAVRIRLSLPDFLVRTLSEKLGALDSATLGDLLRRDGDGCQRDLEEFCSLARTRSKNARAFPARLRAAVFDWWVGKTNDDSLAALVSGSTEFAPAPPLFYFSVADDDLERLHLQRLADLGWTPAASAISPLGIVGSYLRPTSTAIGALVNRLQNDIVQAARQFEARPANDTVAALHNAIVVYTLILAIFGTGHRRATSYCFSTSTLSLDDFLAVIADKVINAGNASRPVGLPDLCQHQIREYFSHLPYLAAYVARTNPVLGAQIQELCNANRQHPQMPLFFLLNPELTEWREIGVDVLENLIGEVWPFPLNAPRDILASELRPMGLNAEANHYRAGHIGLGQDPWGQWSALVPKETLKNSSMFANRLLEGHGWRVMSGMNAGRARKPTFKAADALPPEPPHRIPALEKARAVTSGKTRRIVREFIRKASRPEQLSASQLEALQAEAVTACEGNPVMAAIVINLSNRWLRRNKDDSAITKLPPYVLGMADPPAFGPETAVELRTAREFRKALLQHMGIEKSARDSGMLARLALCLIGFGGILRGDWVRPALVACAGAFQADGRIWLEIQRHDDEGELLEFDIRPLDPVCTLLVARLRRSGKLQQLDAKTLGAAERDIEQALLRLRRQTGNSSFPLTLADACRTMRPFFRFELPGFLAALADGREDGFSLNRPDFLRVVCGLNTRPLEIGEPAESGTPELITAGATRPKKKPGKKMDLAGVVKSVNQILLEGLPPASRGGKQKSFRAARYSDALKKLDELSLPEDAPLLLTLLLNWVRSLIREGGSRERNLQISSIRTYWLRIVTALVEFGAEFDFGSADDEDFEVLYAVVLDAGAKRSRPRRARALRDFHNRCGLSLPTLDWYEIEPNINIDRKRVAAQVITPAEFDACMAALKEANGDFLPLRAALILLYRAGLRLGDVMRLTPDDIVFDDDGIRIYIRRNRFGQPKTRAGRRVIRLAAPLLRNEEREYIADLRERRLLCCNGDGECALFGPSSDGAELFERKFLERSVCEILRWATGRPNARAHDLRHSAGSYRVAAAMPPDHSSSIWKQLKEYFGSERPDEYLLLRYFGDARPTRRVLHAISAELGHATPRSTLTYIHLHNLALAKFLWQSAQERIDDLDTTISVLGEGPDPDRSTWRGSAYDIAEALTGLSNNELRRLKSARSIDVGCPASLAAVMMERVPMPHGVELLPADERGPFAPHRASKGPSLESLHLAIGGIARELEVDRIATLSGIDATLVERLELLVWRRKRKCDYTHYFERKMPTPNAGSTGSADLYERFTRLLEGPVSETVREGLEAWADAYRKSAPGIAFSDMYCARDMIGLCDELGISRDRLRISRPSDWTAQESKDMIASLQSIQGGPFSADFFESHKPSKTNSYSQIPMLVVLVKGAAGKDKRARDMTEFHQYCYLSWISLQL
jgi:integrase